MIMMPKIFSDDDNFTKHPLLRNIWEAIKKEGWNVDEASYEVKPDETHLENLKAAWDLALSIADHTPISEAARVVERIQICMTNAQRIAFITHAKTATKAYQMIKHLLLAVREIFHEIKSKRAA